MNHQEARQRCIIYAYRGSIAHGTYLHKKDPYSVDDKDTLGVYIPPIEYLFGLREPRTIEHKEGDEDAVYYDIQKMFSLLLKCNPNVLSILWLQPKHYIFCNELGQMMIDNKSIFVTKAAYHSFSGYAYAQLKRLHHYSTEGYMGQRRKELVERFGYDTKNAGHLIRLLRMGIEFLTEGRLYVERSDAPMLVSIKRGEWTLEKVQAEADRLFAAAEQAYINSPLPAEPKRDEAEKLLIQIIRKHFMWPQHK